MRVWVYLALCAGGAFSIALMLGVLARLVMGTPAYGATLPGCGPTRPGTIKMQVSDRTDMARTIFGEGRGESLCGQIAIGHTILNRLQAGRPEWGSTISAVVRRPHQFSVWTGARRRARLERLDLADPAYATALLAATLVLSGAVGDPTHGSTHFVSAGIPLPRWARGMTRHRIGNHVFLKAAP